MAGLDGDETSCYPEEFYLVHPLDKKLTTGSLLKRRKDESCYVIMTPACDLVPRRNGKPKVDWIILAMIVPEDTLFKALKANGGRKKTLKNNNDKNCYHWLPKSKVFDGGFLDFCQLQTVPYEGIYSEFDSLNARVAPSFIKDVVSRFSTYYARQGQPTIKRPEGWT